MKKYNPTKTDRGERNLFCSHYSNCLDYAIKEGWNSWDCSRCALKYHRVDKEALSICTEEIPYYEFGGGFSSSDLDSLVS